MTKAFDRRRHEQHGNGGAEDYQRLHLYHYLSETSKLNQLTITGHRLDNQDVDIFTEAQKTLIIVTGHAHVVT